MNQSDLLLWNGERYQGFLVIQNHDLHAGFSALLLYALNGIRKAESTHSIPIIDFNRDNCSSFYDSKMGESIWQYFFESVSPCSYEQVKLGVEEGLLPEGAVCILSRDETSKTHQYDPDRIATFWAWDVPKNKQQWMTDKRSLGRQYVRQYVNPKQHIDEKVEQFVATSFSENTIGVQIRGTDFAYAEPVPISVYLQEVDRLLLQYEDSDTSVFVATDQNQYLDQFKNAFGEKVIYLNALRSNNHIAPFRFDDVGGYSKGEDVLLDILLLSRCHHLVKGPAAVGEIALWFNQSDRVTDFALISKFNQKGYALQESTYAQLNIDQKSNVQLWFHRLRERLVREFVAHRIGVRFFSRFRLMRKIFRH